MRCQLAANEAFRPVLQKELEGMRREIRVLRGKRCKIFICKFLFLSRFKFRKARFLCWPEHRQKTTCAHRKRQGRHSGTVTAAKTKAKRLRCKQAVNRGTRFRARICATHEIDFAQVLPHFFGSMFTNPSGQIWMMPDKKPNTPKNPRDMFKGGPVAAIERLLDDLFYFAPFRHRQRPEFIARETLVQFHEEPQNIGIRTILKQDRTKQCPRNLFICRGHFLSNINYGISALEKKRYKSFRSLE